MKKLLKLSALAILAISGATVGASAQVSPAAVAGDLILGFRTTGTDTVNLEFNLGLSSNFTTSYSHDFGNLTADLTNSAAYGSGALTLANLVYGVAGTGSAGPLTASTNAFDVTLTSGVATLQSNTNLGGTKQKIAALIGGANNSGTGFQSLADGATIIGTTGSSAIVASSVAGSYSNELGSNPTTGAFGNTNIASIDDSSTTGVAGTTLGLYEFTNGSTSTAAPLIGNFAISNTGELTFNGAAAVPEPSSYALALCAVALFIVLRRRNMIV